MNLNVRATMRRTLYTVAGPGSTTLPARHLAGPRRDAASNPHSRHAARTERSENPSTMASSRSASADRPTSRAPANGTRNASRAGTPRASRDR